MIVNTLNMTTEEALEAKLAKVRDIAAAGSGIAGMVVFFGNLLPLDEAEAKDLKNWESFKSVLDAILKAIDE